MEVYGAKMHRTRVGLMNWNRLFMEIHLWSLQFRIKTKWVPINYSLDTKNTNFLRLSKTCKHNATLFLASVHMWGFCSHGPFYVQSKQQSLLARSWNWNQPKWFKYSMSVQPTNCAVQVMNTTEFQIKRNKKHHQVTWGNRCPKLFLRKVLIIGLVEVHVRHVCDIKKIHTSINVKKYVLK